MVVQVVPELLSFLPVPREHLPEVEEEALQVQVIYKAMALQGK
jgi:hypothetical protein